MICPQQVKRNDEIMIIQNYHTQVYELPDSFSHGPHKLVMDTVPDESDSGGSDFTKQLLAKGVET